MIVPSSIFYHIPAILLTVLYSMTIISNKSVNQQCALNTDDSWYSMESLHTKWFHCYSGGLLGYQSINSQSQIIPLLHFCLVVADDKRDDLERQGPDGRGRSRQHQQQDRSRGTKRKHSSSQDDCGGGPPLHDMVDDSVSPHNALSLLCQTSVADESYLDEKYGISDKNKLDAKNSRRKMERPRKRKKESESDGDGGTGDTITDLDNPGSPSLETILNGTVDSETQSEPGVVTSAVVSSSAASHHSASSEVGSPSSLSVSSKLKSPTGTTTTPEDLTVKNGNGNPTPTTTPVGVQSPGITPSRHNASYASQNSDAVVEKWATPAINGESYDDVPTSSSSVRDLEEVMNKHLPALPSEADSLRGGLHAEFTSSSLGFQKHKSTIQWIGSHHPHHQHHNASSPGVATDTLPATHLLRTLYANRESVIRTNVYNPRPQYYGDITQTSLLTPPGSTTDPYKDMSPFSTPQVRPGRQDTTNHVQPHVRLLLKPHLRGHGAEHEHRRLLRHDPALLCLNPGKVCITFWPMSRRQHRRLSAPIPTGWHHPRHAH